MTLRDGLGTSWKGGRLGGRVGWGSGVKCEQVASVVRQEAAESSGS